MASSRLPVDPRAAYRVARQVRVSTEGRRTLAVGGAEPLADALRHELATGADPGAILAGDRLDEAAVLVYVLAAAPDAEDERALKAAARKRVPIVAVLTGASGDGPIPYVLATDLVRVPSGAGLPLGEIARAIARRVDERDSGLAASVPRLRRAVVEELVRRSSRSNGLIGAAPFVRPPNLPVLTLNQVRLVLRIAAAHGEPVDRERLPEVLGVVAGALGFRAFARHALARVSTGGWAVRGGVAYLGTRAVGEAATRYFERRSEATRPPASASPAAP